MDKKRVDEILSKLTLKQKASLLYGKNFWYLKGSEASEELPDIMLTDGPSGLRKQNGKADMMGINESVPAVAFPTGSAAACSWDIDLMYEMGAAIGDEAAKEGVSVVLGPAVNHMRDPLCGRNFEYLSEDPYLTGKLGAAYVKGLQSKGVGSSVKHFAANSREDGRMFCDSLIDERALREIYLKPFEIIVKESQPYTIMSAYNKINGTHCAQNKRLMTDIARNEWGYEGLFLTDWGAMRDQLESYRAGLDLETPGTFGSDDDLEKAVLSGELDENVLNERAGKVIELLLRSEEKADETGFDPKDNLAVAQRIAEESAVLLKNEGVLPLSENDDFCVIGGFAENPRYQGGGSSKINPLKLDNFLSCLPDNTAYAKGYDDDDDGNGGKLNERLIDDAVKLAKKHKTAIIFAGLPESCESEGCDRKTLDMPKSHNALIEAVAKVNPNTVVLLFCGGPVTMHWLPEVKGVLLMHLGGCMSGKAAYNLIFGKSNPCGKLTQTFPLKYGDCPSAKYYNKHEDYDEYRESIFTGYRYYDTVKKEVLFPFGFGLSYTSFEYTDLRVNAQNGKISVCANIKNNGEIKGKEIVQLYVSHKNSTIFKPEKELKYFKKIELGAGETKEVTFELSDGDFAFYNAEESRWQTEGGEYEIILAASSKDIRLKKTLHIDGETVKLCENYKNKFGEYYNLKADTEISEECFLSLAKLQKPTERDKSKITVYSPIKDLEFSAGGKELFEGLKQRAISSGNKADFLTAMDMPIINMTMNSERTRGYVYDFLKKVNGEEK